MIFRIFIGILLFAFFSNSLLAKTYTREYTYYALPADSKLTSRIIAVDQVRILLLLKIGSHIQQTIKITDDSSVDSYSRKNVETVTANLTNINVTKEKWDVESYYIKAEIDADTQLILHALEEYKKDASEKSRQLLKSLTLNESALQKSREKITRLNRELESSKTGPQNTKAIIEYKAEVNKLSTEEIVSEGFKNYQQGEHAEAFKMYLEISKQGNTVAQQLLGSLYMNGQGVKQDFTKAVYWFQNAADKDDSIA